jgi:hypothetical protein
MKRNDRYLHTADGGERLADTRTGGRRARLAKTANLGRFASKRDAIWRMSVLGRGE